MKLPQADAVHLNSLSSEARQAIMDALFDSGYDVGQSWIDFDLCCGLYFRLRHAKNSPELFPKGKWTTLARLEDIIMHALKSPDESEP